MKKHSCGAILYTIYNCRVYIILGMEKGEWFPFKGTREKGETNDEAAIREIYEETCTIVDVTRINLDCHYSTKRKHYHIGLIHVEPCIMNKFYEKRNIIEKKEFLEKTSIRAFALDELKPNYFHAVTRIPIQYYYWKLKTMQMDITTDQPRLCP
jgi:8-oxo-dGTP pyrophosphatase MutT (NUDIX family)